MPISSLIVRVYPKGEEALRNMIATDARIELTDERGLDFILLTETQDPSEDREIYTRLQATPDVESLNLIYHNLEDLETAS